ncbi:hypothetical protein [Nostoc sp. CMAA1605]|uniref:hypothetical protein n=1 Tax=Nostoc sp. CMAA1605 TaxID=2055159 RepID=UPI001F296D7C|nr:hypothetical protein [Nostoc sp. CMAA1605]MCF4969326.1 hypothetical protein [Nostoc sp. CMAA1605]
MRLSKIIVLCLILIANFMIARPSWADRPNLTKLPQYTEVTQALDDLLTAQFSSEASSYTPTEIEKKIVELQLQKYILESARGWSQCLNQTGKVLGIYAHKPKKSNLEQEGDIYFLGDGQITENKWNCDGIYLPIGAKIAAIAPSETQPQELTEPLVVKFVPGTQLVVTTNQKTGTIEFNVPPAKIVKTGEGSLSIPNFSLAEIDAQVPNAPTEH